MGLLKLTVQLSGRTLKHHTLGSERKVLIGRAPECDVVIDNLGISRTHCELFWAGHCWVLQDLRSNNGTFVNGRKVATHNVNDGDEITIGKFKIICELPVEELEFEIEPPVKIPGYGEATLSVDARKQDKAGAASRVKGHLILGGKGRRTAALDKTIFVIGKSDSADVKVEGLFIRHKHALIIRDDAGFLLADTGGRLGTYINETRIDTERLKDGDEIRVGKRTFTFVVGTESA